MAREMDAASAYPGTIAAKIAAANGHATGFDFLRIALAISVILFHSMMLAYGGIGVDEHPARAIVTLILPMFFALSGFLVAGSLDRTPTMRRFLTLRAVRLVPALFVETLLCALIIGPLFTTFALGHYFTDREFFLYFGNMIGWIHYELPGVFETNPTGGMVNMSLWTVPFELECYIGLTILALLGIVKRRWILLAIVVIGSIAMMLDLMAHGGFRSTDEAGRLLVLAFLAGLVVQRFQDRLPHHWLLGGLALILSIALMYDQRTRPLGVFAAAYLTAYIGALQIPPLPVFKNGDYSYGMYLFAFPMQQAAVALFPDAREWWVNAAFGIVASFLYAMFSWHCIEKPVLSRKAKILNWVDAVWTAIPRLFQPSKRAPETSAS